MAAMFNREASFDDNRSDIYDDDEDRGFFQMNESDEGTISILMRGKSGYLFTRCLIVPHILTCNWSIQVVFTLYIYKICSVFLFKHPVEGSCLFS